jgi:toxin ParE1/3/4
VSRELIIRPEAQAELAEAFDWYERQRPGLGEELLAHVEAGLAQIRHVPKRNPIIYKQVRRLLIRRFPYSIFYSIDDDRITVLAILHGSRDPRRWQRRA